MAWKMICHFKKYSNQIFGLVEYYHKKTSTIKTWVLERLRLKLSGPQIFMFRSLPFLHITLNIQFEQIKNQQLYSCWQCLKNLKGLVKRI